MALVSEARLPLVEASAALRSGERRTYCSLFTSEIDNVSNDDFESQFENDDLAGFEFDNDDFEPEEGDDFADFDNFLEAA